MKKVVMFLLFAILLASFVIAANETNTSTSLPVTVASDMDSKIEKAYTCLKDRVKDKCSSLSLEDQAFSLLALSYDSSLQSECRKALGDKKDSKNCWPSGSCTLKGTALSALALNRLGESTKSIEDWLLSKNKTASGLVWYLEIDTNKKSSCTISYDSRTYSTDVGEDDKLSSSAGSCLSLSEGSYWLQVSQSCIGKTFKIMCDEDFLTTLLYKKQDSQTTYVSSLTHPASAASTTEETVSSYCFATGTSCEYEGSLWAALFLSKKGYDMTPYLPYLITGMDDNGKYLPNSFLYLLTGYEDYLSALLGQQKSNKYWEASGTAYTKFYDTALAMYVMQEISTDEKDRARNYLITAQGNDGCWQSVRDTAFLLFSGWQKPALVAHASEIPSCTGYGYYCLTTVECNAVGDILPNYDCSGSGLKKCCNKPAQAVTCSEKGGKKCGEEEECSISTVTSSDAPSCCLGDCIPIAAPEQCSDMGSSYSCKPECDSSTESEISSLSCDSGLCCKKQSTSGGGGSSWWWIILLIILIIIVVLAIIYREKIKEWFAKRKTSGGSQPSRPGFGAGPSMPPRPISRTFIPQQPGRPVARPMIPSSRPAAKPVSSKDRELSETLRKLKEMSK